MSKTGLVLAGLYAAFAVLTFGCSQLCTSPDTHHGNLFLVTAPFIPAELVLNRLPRQWELHFGLLPGYFSTILITVLAFYLVGWLTGAMGSSLYRAARYVAVSRR